MKHRSISLYKKVLKRRSNRAIIANFDVQFVLNKMETYLEDNPPPLESKRNACSTLHGKCNLARRMFMNLDDSIYPSAVWNSEDGTIISSSKTDDVSSDSSSDRNHSIANEVELAEPTHQNPANVPDVVHQDETITASDEKKFVKGLITTMGFITDPSNIDNQLFIDFWAEYRGQLILDVGAALGVPISMIKKWMSQAELRQ